MNGWTMLEDAAWIFSAIILVYLVLDAIRINRSYGEDFLTSSREGELETAEHDEEVRTHHA